MQPGDEEIGYGLLLSILFYIIQTLEISIKIR